MVKYKYKNETVLKEFVGKFLRALASRKGKQIAKLLSADPAMKKMLKKSADLESDLEKHVEKRRKEDPELDARLSALARL
jgi:hypothetical protein|tara:strand:+ start:451 stop:690 length:240 start_codon:yes stop_codon:yes gene_type:complete